MQTTRPWAAYMQTLPALQREERRWDGIALKWRATEMPGRRLCFHQADFPVRIWAVAIRAAGVIWAEVDKIVSIDELWVKVRYASEPGRLSRDMLERTWTLWRGVYFASERSGYAARMFDKIWQDRYGHRHRTGGGVPPQMQMPLAEAAALLGVPANFTREDVIAAFRRMAKRAHPDVGGTAEQFRQLIAARDRLLASIGASAPAPKMPKFAPKGLKMRAHPPGRPSVSVITEAPH